MVRHLSTVAHIAGRIVSLLLWPVRSLRRLVILGWLVGFEIVGAADMAYANPVNNIVTGPDLAAGSAPTVFERIPWDSYSLPFNISDSASGVAGVGTALYGAVNGVCDGLIFMAGALVRGGIDAVEWVLQLTGLYKSQAASIDQAVQSVAGAVFWPLIAATTAAAGFTLFAKARRDGNGSIVGEFVHLLVFGVIAVAVVMAPSTVLGTLDDARTAVTDAGMTGYAHAAGPGSSTAGFPDVAVPQTSTGAVRSLADSLWNVYFVTPWCFAAFGEDLSLCKNVGSDYLTRSQRWQQIDQSQTDRKGGNSATCTSDGGIDAYLACKDKAWCADEVQAKCEWVRGESWARVGAVLFVLVISIPLALMLLGLAIFGVIAVVGLMLLILMCPLFLVGAIIPGRPRAIAVKYFEALLGMLLQSVVITFVIGAVMVLGGIFNSLLPTFGLLFVALLNIAAMVMGFRVRGMFENLTGLSHPGHRGMVSTYVAMKGLGAAGRGARRVTGAAAGAASAGARTAGLGVAAAARHGAGGFMSAGGRGLPASTAASRGGRLRQHFAVPAVGKLNRGVTAGVSSPPAVEAGSFAQTPQYDGSHGRNYAIPGRTVDALPTSTPPSRRALPAAASTLASTSGPATGKPPASTSPAKPGTPAKPQDPARTFTSASTSHPGVVHSVKRQIVMPSLRNMQTPAWRADPLVVTRSPKPPTPRADLPVRPRRDGTK